MEEILLAIILTTLSVTLIAVVMYVILVIMNKMTDNKLNKFIQNMFGEFKDE